MPVYTLTAVADTMVDSVDTTTNFGGSVSFSVGLTRYEGLVRFDIASTGINPANESVVSAVMGLNFAGGSGGTITFNAHAILAAWAEMTVTWNTRPSYRATPECSVGLLGAAGYKDYTPLVEVTEEWLFGTLANNGIWVRTTSGGYHNYNSREAASDRPRLVITTVPRPTITLTSPNGTQVNPTVIADSVTPNLVGNYTSPSALNMAHRQHIMYDELGNVVWDSGKVAAVAASGDTITVTVPAGYLRYGRKYRWKWRAWSSDEGRSLYTAEGWFTCLLTQAINPIDLAASDHLLSIHPTTGQVVVEDEGATDFGNPVAFEWISAPIPVRELLKALRKKTLNYLLLGVDLPAGSGINAYHSLKARDTGVDDWIGPKAVTVKRRPDVIRLDFGKPKGEFIRLKFSGDGPFEIWIMDPNFQVHEEDH